MPLGTTNSDPTSDRKMSFFTPVFRPDLWEIMLSLHPLRLERQQKRFLKIHFEFPYSSFFFYSEGNWNDKYLHTLALVVSSKIIPNSRPKWAKSIPVFRPKPEKNSTFWGCTYLQGLCMGVTPSPPPPRHQRELYESQETRPVISWPLTFARGMPSLLHFSHTTGYAGHSFSWWSCIKTKIIFLVIVTFVMIIIIFFFSRQSKGIKNFSRLFLRYFWCLVQNRVAKL